METQTFLKNNAEVIKNIAKVMALKNEKPTKLNKLAIHLLRGHAVTGAVMIRNFNIYSYRDAIYDLTKKGYEIASKTVYGENGVSHKVWWLACFSEEFAVGKMKRACETR